MKNAKWIIDLNALTHNAKYLIESVHKKSNHSKYRASNAVDNPGVIAIVKNNAYNLGLEKAVQSFYSAGIRTFATTSLRDCISIRKIYEDVNIILINPCTDFDILRDNGIMCTMPSFEFIKKNKDEMQGIKWHIEWSGYMRRSGCRSKGEIFEALEFAYKNKIEINGIWTHFSWADTFDENKTYEEEKSLWLSLLDDVLNEYRFDFIHSQNSASFARDDILPFHTHIRPGILLYGCYPHDFYEDNNILHSIEVSGNVISIINLEKGDSIGYCSSFTSEKDTRVAVVNIGYGDGILKKRGIGHEVLVNGKRYKIVTMMMSHTVIEIDVDVSVRDKVIFFGKDIPIHEFTKKGLGACSEHICPLNHNTLDVEYILIKN